MRILRFGALTLLLSLISFAGVASADDRPVALLPFQGPQAAKVRQNVQKGLDAAEVELVSLKRVNSVVKSTKGYAKQAAKLQAGALVRARIRRVEGRWVADAEVRSAKGQRVEKFRVSSSNMTRLSNRIVAQLLKTGRMPLAGVIAEASKAKPETPAPTKPRLVIRPFTGAQAAKIRGAAVRGLRSGSVELFPNKKFTAEAKSLGADLKSEGGHVAPASALAVSGLIDGDVLHEDGVWSAYVRLTDGDSANVISQHYYDASTASALAKSVQTNIGSDFRKDIKNLGVKGPGAAVAAPIAAATPAPVAPAKTKEEDEPKKTKKKRPKGERPAAVDIEVDFRVVHRTFRYNEDLRGDLRDYTLSVGPGVGIKFQYYPGAHFTAGVGAQFGVDFEWERLFNIDSTRADGQTFPTDSQQFLIGLRWRYPKGRWEPSVVLGYGVHNFGFGLSGPPVPGEDNQSRTRHPKREIRVRPTRRRLQGCHREERDLHPGYKHLLPGRVLGRRDRHQPLVPGGQGQRHGRSADARLRASEGLRNSAQRGLPPLRLRPEPRATRPAVRGGRRARPVLGWRAWRGLAPLVAAECMKYPRPALRARMRP